MKAVTPNRRPLRLGEKLVLSGEIVAAYAQARWRLRRGDIRSVVVALRCTDPKYPDLADPVQTGRRLGAAVAQTLGRLPADSRCLMRSLVLTRLLARRGIHSSIVVGVQPGQSFAAHAWVEHGGTPLLPPGEDAFERLVEL